MKRNVLVGTQKENVERDRGNGKDDGKVTDCVVWWERDSSGTGAGPSGHGWTGREKESPCGAIRTTPLIDGRALWSAGGDRDSVEFVGEIVRQMERGGCELRGSPNINRQRGK